PFLLAFNENPGRLAFTPRASLNTKLQQRERQDEVGRRPSLLYEQGFRLSGFAQRSVPGPVIEIPVDSERFAFHRLGSQQAEPALMDRGEWFAGRAGDGSVEVVLRHGRILSVKLGERMKKAPTVGGLK